MSFAVVWEPAATGDIDKAWAVAPVSYRTVIEDALESLLRSLRNEPSLVGESRGLANERVAFAPPLVVYFRIEINKVRILAASVAFPRE